MRMMTLAALTLSLSLTVLAPRAAAAPAGYKAVGFETLSEYNFEVPGQNFADFGAARRALPKLKSQIPDQVRALDGKK